MKTIQDYPTINERPPEGLKSDGTAFKVLVVDDSMFVAKQLGQILASEGYDVVATAAVNRRNVCTRRRCDGGDVVHASGVRLQNRERHDVGLGQHSTVEVCDDACREVCDTNLLSIRVGHDRTGVDEVIPGSVLQVENVVDSLETDVVTKYNCSCKEVDIADEQVTGQIHDIDVRRIRNRCDKANLDACLVCNGQVTIAKVNTVSRQKPSIVARRNGRLLLRNAIIAAGRWLVV